MQMIQLERENIAKGNLILVNKEHCLPVEKRDKTDNLYPFDSNHKDILLEARASAMIYHIMEVIGNDGAIIPVSGYRPYDEQEMIWKDTIKSNGPDYTGKFVALPGASEHQTGLAVDLAKNSDSIDFICPDFPDEGICRAFQREAPKYGFIKRYTKEKEAITGIAEEPWHFRYVGYPHSQIMKDEDLSLEEYIDYLKKFPYDGKHYKYRNNRQEIEIFFVPIYSFLQVGVPLDDNKCYQVSGNNEDGFIVTLWRV